MEEKGKTVLGINRPCQACGLEGSPLYEDWIFFSACDHVVHKECAHNYHGRCGECGKKSQMLKFDKKRRTEFEHAAKTMKALGKNDQFQAHLFELMDNSSKHLKAKLGALKSMAQDKREEAKIRMKSKLLLRRARKSLPLERFMSEPPSTSPEERYVTEAQRKPHEYEEIDEGRGEVVDGREDIRKMRGESVDGRERRGEA